MRTLKLITLLPLVLAVPAEAAGLARCPSGDAWDLTCVNSPHVYKSALHTGRPVPKTYVDPMFAQFVGTLCNIGGLASTFAPEPILVTGTAVACVVSAFAQANLPPPKPIYVKGKEQKLYIVIDNRKAAKKAPEQPPVTQTPNEKPPAAQPQEVPPETPMTKAPEKVTPPSNAQPAKPAAAPTVPPVRPQIINPGEQVATPRADEDLPGFGPDAFRRAVFVKAQ